MTYAQMTMSDLVWCAGAPFLAAFLLFGVVLPWVQRWEAKRQRA